MYIYHYTIIYNICTYIDTIDSCTVYVWSCDMCGLYVLLRYSVHMYFCSPHGICLCSVTSSLASTVGNPNYVQVHTIWV